MNVQLQKKSMPTPWKAIGNSLREGDFKCPKFKKQSIKLNWNFPGGGGEKTKNLPWGEYGYFLELHNIQYTPIGNSLEIENSAREDFQHGWHLVNYHVTYSMGHQSVKN